MLPEPHVLFWPNKPSWSSLSTRKPVCRRENMTMYLMAVHCCKGWFGQMSRDMTKPTKWPVRPAKTQISLGIRPVWSESSLCAQKVTKDPSFLHADSEDSDQTGRMPRLIWVFPGRTVTLLVLSCRGSNGYTCTYLQIADLYHNNTAKHSEEPLRYLVDTKTIHQWSTKDSAHRRRADWVEGSLCEIRSEYGGVKGKRMRSIRTLLTSSVLYTFSVAISATKDNEPFMSRKMQT